MKSFIDLNTKYRQASKNDFEKSLFKLMSNAPFGKSTENVRGRIDFQLAKNTDEFDNIKRLKKVTIFDENLVGCHCAKYSVKLCKPIYMGAAILDDSKVTMFNFHYNFMMKQIAPENLKLLFTDTDSLCYEVKKTDMYELMKENSYAFDLSEFLTDDQIDEDIKENELK